MRENMSKHNTHAVILLNYNGLTDSLECIKSILNAKNANDIEIIVVDNASTKDEGKIIKEKYPDITVINNNINNGFSAGNNLGIQYALRTGFSYITLLNNDTIVSEDMFLELEKLCSNNSVAVPKMYYYDKPNFIWYGGGDINRKTGNAIHWHMGCEDNYEEKTQKCTFATGCCIMIHAASFRKVGLLNESYFMYCEDTDFCIRLQQTGISIYYVPTAHLWHKVSSSTGGSNSPFAIYYMTRNRLNYIKKYHNYFKKSAYPFSIISRCIRMIESPNKAVRTAFKRGILDHIRHVEGRSKYY